jgi:hypothetical protein
MKPNGNGIIEMVDDRSSDRGFFCMDLVGHITDDPQFDGSWEYWHLRFYEAKTRQCKYADICSRHAKTISRLSQKPLQLKLFN